MIEPGHSFSEARIGAALDEYLLDHHRRLRDLIRRVDQLERNQMTEQEQVGALETAVAKVAEDLATTQATLQTELNELQAKINAGETVDLTKLTAAVGTLDPAVEALAALKPAAPAQPTSETVSVSIGASGEGSIQILQPLSRVTITTQPSNGTATLAEVEGSPDATKLAVTAATPETTASVVISIAAA